MQSPPINKFTPHDHPCSEITLVLCGEVSIFVEGREFKLSAGDYIIMPPITIHEGKSDTEYIDTSLQIDVPDLVTEPTVLHDSGETLKKLMEVLVKLWTEKGDDNRVICEDLSTAISRYVGRNLRHDMMFPGLEEFKNVIYENISNPTFSVSSAIAATGYNDDYFRRRFKAAMGETPLEYMTHLRLNRACDLLLRHDYHSVERVAALCGFLDSFYFSTCFKKHIGTSPLKYRQMNLYRD
jgi:AraC-like DNA-binding protein